MASDLVVYFQILNGKTAGTSWTARRLPVRIGRAPGSDLCLDDPGVWDEHLEVALGPEDSFEVSVCGSALALLNGTPMRKAVLRSGDVLHLGATELRFGLSPAAQRSLRLRELLTWLALVALCLGQVALIYFLG